MIYKKGDLIGQKYEVHDVIGMGGFGIVYLVYTYDTNSVFAFKTFRDEYLEDIYTRGRFSKEAQIWIDLERHPYLVRAYFVDEIAGRLFILMEYIAPNEQGLNSLECYLRYRPLDLAQSLRWSIQFCHGMEHAYSRGIHSHRDIKPANIMIDQNKIVKISDFGLAGIIESSKATSRIKLSIHHERVGFSCQTMEGAGFGTPTHMPPEQFTNASRCDERSDIYSFGITLYQMASENKLPFLATFPRNNSDDESIRFWLEMYNLHSKALIPKLNSPLFPIIQGCLEKEPDKRYASFKDLRSDLESLLKRRTGEVIRLPLRKDLEAWEWNNKGIGFYNLYFLNEASNCFDKALELNPLLNEAWVNKGNSLLKLGLYSEASKCYIKALEINPHNELAWNNVGICIKELGYYDKAIGCYNKALDIDPHYAAAWSNKGNILFDLSRYDEAIQCYEKAVDLNHGSETGWYGKGNSLQELGRYDEAILCYKKTLEINSLHEYAWYNIGNISYNLHNFVEAIRCYKQVLEINPQMVIAWYGKALTEEKLGLRQAATHSLRQFIALASNQYVAQIEYAQQKLQELEEK